MEIATEEHEQSVARAYEKATAAVLSEQSISDELRLIHNVEHMMQKANSGASFEQYFRWASLEEIRAVPGQLASSSVRWRNSTVAL